MRRLITKKWTGMGIAVALLIAAVANAQFITIGGTGYEYGTQLIQTADGGYAIVGSTTSFTQGVEDCYVIKLDAKGNLQWAKAIGGSGIDIATAIIQTSDKGYAIAGQSNSFDPNSRFDCYIVKLDSAGNLEWDKAIGGTNDEYALSILQTSDGGYLVAGSTTSFGLGWADIYLVKLDANGNVQWTKTIGGIDDDVAFDIIQTSDGGYAIVGFTLSFCNAGCPATGDAYIVKLDANGNLQWTKVIGGADDEVASAIAQTNDNGYIVVGRTRSFGRGDYDMYVIKMDGNGNIQWTKTIGGDSADVALSVVQTSDGGYAIAGWSHSFLPRNAIGSLPRGLYIVKLDASGNLQWTRTIGEIAPGYILIADIVETSNSSLLVTSTIQGIGNGNTDVLLLRLGPNGNINIGNCAQIIADSGSTSSGGSSVSGGAIASASADTASGGIISSGGSVYTCIPFTSSSEEAVNFYPLQWRIDGNDVLWVKLPEHTPNAYVKIMNIEGRTIYTAKIIGKDWLRIGKLPTKGIYLLQYTTKQKTDVEKIAFFR